MSYDELPSHPWHLCQTNLKEIHSAPVPYPNKEQTYFWTMYRDNMGQVHCEICEIGLFHQYDCHSTIGLSEYILFTTQWEQTKHLIVAGLSTIVIIYILLPT